MNPLRLPAQFVTVTSLPHLANGKVDRRTLPIPGIERPEQLRQYVAPRTDTETQLARIWSGVLGLERVGALDNFFELGGDSILMIQVVARARSAGLAITPVQVLQNQTVAELGLAIGSPPQGTLAEQCEVTGEVELTPIFRWFLEHEPLQPSRRRKLADRARSCIMTRGRGQRRSAPSAVSHDRRGSPALG